MAAHPRAVLCLALLLAGSGSATRARLRGYILSLRFVKFVFSVSTRRPTSGARVAGPDPHRTETAELLQRAANSTTRPGTSTRATPSRRGGA